MEACSHSSYCTAHRSKFPTSQNSALGFEHGTSYTQWIWTERRSGRHEYGPFWIIVHFEVHPWLPWVSRCCDIRLSYSEVGPACWETHRIQPQLLLVSYPPIFCHLCSITVVLSECISILEPIHSFSGCLGAELLYHLIERRDHRFMRNPWNSQPIISLAV